MHEDPQDEWQNFETYKGVERRELPKWLNDILKCFFGFLFFAGVFAICGFLVWIIVYRYGGGYGHMSRSFAVSEQPWMSWARFIGGGSLGVIALVWYMFKKRK